MVLLACNDADLDAGRESSQARQALARAIDQYCNAECRRLDECLTAFTRSACVSACKADTSLTRIANATMVQVAGCFDRAACSSFSDETVYATCFEEAAATSEPTEQCEDFCIMDVTYVFECGGGYDIDQCLHGAVCTWSDSVLATASDCQQLDCEARQTCLKTAFDAAP